MANNAMNRRDFLKMFTLATGSLVVSPLLSGIAQATTTGGHIIIIVFDAWSANNVQIYGYPRDTMPNLEKFSEKAIVYHRNYSAGNFTIPGTASIFSGLYPWSHRAFAIGGVMSREHSQHTIFNVLAPIMGTIGFAQNVNADTLIAEAGKDVKEHIPFGAYNLHDRVMYDAPLFKNDAYTAFLSLENSIINHEKGRDGSLFAGPAIRLLSLEQKDRLTDLYGKDYGGNLPDNYEAFTLPKVVNGLIKVLGELTQPSLVYFHVHPPHKPNHPYPHNFRKFEVDNYKPIAKPYHPLVIDPKPYGKQIEARLNYDAFMASWDEEAGRLFRFLESSGIMDNSHIIITSDHGELHERGHFGHTAPIHFEPLVHVPLIISTPGQKKRVDIHHPTSNVDLLPTIATIKHVEIPNWVEGKVLPHFAAEYDPERTIFTFDASQNSAFAELKTFTVSATKGTTRLIKYSWPGYNKTEYYDIADDPEEMNDLYNKQPANSKQMEVEIQHVIENANKKLVKNE